MGLVRKRKKRLNASVQVSLAMSGSSQEERDGKAEKDTVQFSCSMEGRENHRGIQEGPMT